MADGGCEFTVLSKPFCRPLFEGLAENVRFIGADVKNDYRGIGGLMRLFMELDREKFDVVLDMHDVLRTKVLRKLFRLHGYRVYKIDKHRELRKLITAEGDRKQLVQLPTAFENYREVLKRVLGNKGGWNKGERNKDEWNKGDNERQINLQPSTTNMKHSTFNLIPRKVGIAPFAAHEGKIYPLERMEEVIKSLSQKGNEENQTSCNNGDISTLSLSERDGERLVYLFGGGGEEREIMRGWAEKYENVRLASDVCHGLKEELELMGMLDVMVSMDSANMHLASLMGTRVVSIWGATHPFAGFLGWGQSMADCVQRNDLPCRPCSIYGNKPCLRGDMACMDIAAEEIVKRIYEL